MMYRQPVVPAHVLVELYNREHLATAYGERFALAAMQTLHMQVHLWGGLIVSADRQRFVAQLPPASSRSLSTTPLSHSATIERWQAAMTTEPFIHGAQRACLAVGVEPAEFSDRSLSSSSLQPKDIECPTGIPPVLAPPQCGWLWHLSYEIDMAAALAFHQALDHDRASLVFEPIVRAAHFRSEAAASALPAEQILYHEAVLQIGKRAHEASLAPDELVVALERLGLARQLDHVVLYAVIGQLQALPAAQLGCRLSAQSLVPQTGWWAGVLERLHQQPGVAQRLSLEISTSAQVPHFDTAVSFVRQLQALGCRIAIADFGEGQMPLDFIRAVAPQLIKLHGRRVHAAMSDLTKANELQRLVQIAAALAPEVAADGIQDWEAIEAAAAAGIGWLQGPSILPAHHACQTATLRRSQIEWLNCVAR